MEKKQITLPSEKSDYGYGLALRLAREQISKIDVAGQCRKSGAQLAASRKAVEIRYLNRLYSISVPDGEVSLISHEEDIPIRDKILILHYFTQARGTPPSSRVITYKELPEGIHYFPVFYKRAIKPLVINFGSEPSRFLEIAVMLGGRKSDYGDTAVVIDAFSKVPVNFVLWKGDPEFPPEGNIMFDSTISDYLTNEDINVLCETIAWRMVRLKGGGGNPGKNRN